MQLVAFERCIHDVHHLVADGFDAVAAGGLEGSTDAKVWSWGQQKRFAMNRQGKTIDDCALDLEF